ncbi:MAG: hypothetical protein LC715_01660 [Gammaproteobacteria bacterium]|nr:hypothetical protein [Gammaproteobacteria bacterium]
MRGVVLVQRAGFFVFAIATAAILALSPAARAQVSASGDYLARMDGNRDGRVGLTEYQDWLSYAFDAMDRDRDGRLAPSELPGGRGKTVTRSGHRTALAAAFARQDRNRDGSLDARELAAPPP